jgi:iron-sulfur cluster assembly accessory protein
MVKLTETASRKLGEVITQQSQHGGTVFGLRISAYPGGCSGHQYGMELAKEAGPGDWIGEFGGVKVLVDPDSAPMLEGVSIDYVETLQQSGFTISNPNAATGGGCGCGSGGCGCGGH